MATQRCLCSFEAFGEFAHRGVVPPSEKADVNTLDPLDAFPVCDRPGQRADRLAEIA
jgi:hypothetical protein